MKQSSKIIALAVLLVLVATLGAATTDTDQTEAALLPPYGVIREPGGVATTSQFLPYQYIGREGTSAPLFVEPCTGDFNGDGFEDFCLPQIVGEYGEQSDTVTGLQAPLIIAFGDGRGGIDDSKGVQGFQQIDHCAPGPLASGDLNEDGCADLLTHCSDPGSSDSANPGMRIVAWMGSSNCTFVEKTVMETANSTYSLHAVDVDRDGHLDIVAVVLTPEDDIEVMFVPGLGDGGFGPPIISGIDVPLLAMTSSFGVGDVNGDGLLDIAFVGATVEDESLVFLLVVAYGNGVGEFAFSFGESLGYVPKFATVGDVNSDGIDDVCVVHMFDPYTYIDEETSQPQRASAISTSISIYSGSTSDGLQHTGTYDLRTSLRRVYLKDLNGDDQTDVVIVTDNAIGLVMLGMQDGTLSSPLAYSAANGSHSRCWSTGLGDLNNDGAPDLYSQLYDQELVVRFGDGKGGFGTGWMEPPISTDLPIYATRLAGPSDFDQDGKLDLVFLDGSGAGIAYGDGRGSFDEMTVLLEEYGWAAAGVGDFNGDGLDDILFGQEFTLEGGKLALFLNQGDRQFARTESIEHAPQANSVSYSDTVNDLLVGDVNNDGIDDVLVCERYNTYVYLGDRNEPFTRGEPILVQQDESASTVNGLLGAGLFTPRLLDINLDGHLDLAGIERFSLSVRAHVWLGDGTGLFEDIASYPYRHLFKFPLDIDNDGHPDLIALPTEGSPDILFGTDSGAFRAEVLEAAPWARTAHVIDDLNGDGNVDYAEAWGLILWIYLGDGRGGRGERLQFAPHPLGEFSYDLTTLPGDFDGDGRPDIALPSKYQISIILNRFPVTEEQ